MTPDPTPDEDQPHPLVYAAVKTAIDFLTVGMIIAFAWILGWILLHIYYGGGVPL